MFVGAGGSKPEPTNIPLVSELLPTLWQKAEEVNAKHLLELQELCNDLGVDNIEELLTAIDITRSAVADAPMRGLVEGLLLGGPSDRRGRPAPSRQQLRDAGLADRLQETTQTLFSLLVGMMRKASPNAFHAALADRAQTLGNLSVITTNYDISVERALGTGSYWYGGIDSVTASSTAVLKLHGSLNWFACSSCDEVVAAGLEDVASLTSARLYPVVSQCEECDALAPHLIVPPIRIKLAEHPVLLEVRQLAEDALRDAEFVAFVGYSFSETDEYVLKMVSRAVANSNTDILVFDTDYGAVGRLRSFLTAHARGYAVESRVSYVNGDAAKWFPQLVDAWKTARVVTSPVRAGNSDAPAP